MLKQAEKANAAWRQRAAKILQRVDSADEKGPSSKRQKIAKATRLIDADDRPVASASTDNTIPKHVQEDEEVAIPNLARLSARRAAADKVQVTPTQAETTETTAATKAGESATLRPQPETTETPATTKAGSSATLQPQALPAQTEAVAPAGTPVSRGTGRLPLRSIALDAAEQRGVAGTAAAGVPPRAMGQRLSEETMGERMRQQQQFQQPLFAPRR